MDKRKLLNLYAPHLSVSPTDTSFSSSVHFNFCFTVGTRTERCILLQLLRGCSQLRWEGQRPFYVLTCPVCPEFISLGATGMAHMASCHSCHSVNCVMWVDHWIYSFQNVSTRLLEIVLGNLVPGTCLISCTICPIFKRMMTHLYWVPAFLLP